MATCFVLIAEKSTGGVFANKESAEASENIKLMVKLPSLLSSGILLNIVYFIGSNLLFWQKKNWDYS